MTAAQIEALGPALASFLQKFLFCCAYTQTFQLLTVYCRGLLSDLKRKTCEPLANFAGVAVRTLQEFLKDHVWAYADVRLNLQRDVVATLPQLPHDDLGLIGIIYETASRKQGTKSPGVQRQWCGELGKKENCIVTVHLAVVQARYKTIIDAELFLPQSWENDRERCRQADIPNDVHYRPKWRIALEEIDRARGNGLRLDWLTFDEGYGAVPEFLHELDQRHLTFIGEVPKSFACFTRPPRGRRGGHRADNLARYSPVFYRQPWQRFRLKRQTLGDQEWEVKAARVWVSWKGRPMERQYWLIWARNVRTGEEKYFVSNAPVRTALRKLLRVAFSRWNVEHCLRVSKGEIGLRHFEGRSYVALMRHLILCCVTLTFVAGQTERLRGEKSRGHAGAGVRGLEPGECEVVGGLAGYELGGISGGGHWVSPAA